MKQILNEWKRFLKESSLSRLYSHMQDHESAALSAFRNEFTKAENLERNRKSVLAKTDYVFEIAFR